MDNFEILKRIDSFISSYYRNRFIKGLLLSGLLIAAIVLFISLIEYYIWFSINIRFFLFLASIISFSFIIYYFILIPVFRKFHIFKSITQRDACRIVTERFPQINDSLINFYELNQSVLSNIQSELLIAAINQKSNIVKELNFNEAARNWNFKPLISLVSVLTIVYLLIVLLKPDVFVEGTKRVIDYKHEYYKDVKYSIQLNSKDLVVVQGDDLNFYIDILGSERPKDLYLFIGSKTVLLEKISNSKYKASLKSIAKGFSFRIGNDDFKSELFSVSVINQPLLIDIIVEVHFPAYINKPKESLTNIYNFNVPIGSVLYFKANMVYTDSLLFISDTSSNIFIKKDEVFEYNHLVRGTGNYNLLASNLQIESFFAVDANIIAIPDLFPEIVISSWADAIDKNLIFFKGNIYDDYGFSKFVFHVENQSYPVPFQSLVNSQEIFYQFDFQVFNKKEVNYYFEIFDNDGYNGPKGTKSQIYTISFPNFDEMYQVNKEETDKLYNNLEQSLLMMQELQKDIEVMKGRLISENLTDFEKSQLNSQMAQKQQSLQELLNNTLNQNRKLNSYNNSYQKNSDDILEKQEAIDKLMNELMDEELLTLLSKIDSLAKLMEKGEDLQDLQKLKNDYKNLSEQLDKNLELLKRYDVERNLEQIASELKLLSENILSADSIVSIPKLDSVIDNYSKNTNSLNEMYNQILEKNKNLEKPYDLNNLDSSFNKIDSLLNKSDDLNKEKSSDNIEKAGSEAEELSEQMGSMINNNRATENAENAEDLRQILENLIFFSFQQEYISLEMSESDVQSMYFSQLIVSQKNLKVGFQVIKDSLLAVSKRTPMIGTHISKKVYSIQELLEHIIGQLTNGNQTKPVIQQRSTIELANDLVLLLSESLKNMDNMSGSGQGSSKSKSKQKPKPSLGEMRKSQENMKSQLESILDGMNKGQGKSGKSSSESLGKLLAQQEIFQQMINDLKGQAGLGKDISSKLSEIEKLNEQNRKDIINNKISENTFIRQQQIVTRLLESEKAEMERDLDEKRESKEAFDFNKTNPNIILDNDNKSTNFEDILYKNTLKLNYFYKNKYQDYIFNLN